MQVSGIVSKRVFNESAVQYSSRHSCNSAHARSIWSMVSVWPQWWQAVGYPRDKIWDLVAFVWPFRSWVIKTSSALVKCCILSVAPVLVSWYRYICRVQLHPTWFGPTAAGRSWPVASNLFNVHLPVGLCLNQGSLLLVGPLCHCPQCHSGLISSRNKRVPLSLNT